MSKSNPPAIPECMRNIKSKSNQPTINERTMNNRHMSKQLAIPECMRNIRSKSNQAAIPKCMMRIKSESNQPAIPEGMMNIKSKSHQPAIPEGMRNINYEGGSICNENQFISPFTNALGFNDIRQTKDQSFTVIMVHKTLLYLPLISYRLFKKHTNIHCISFPSNCKDSF